MGISVRLSKEDANLIRNYASLHNMSVSELVRQTILEMIYDEYDLTLYNAAMLEYEKDSTTFTIDEVMEELGLK